MILDLAADAAITIPAGIADSSTTVNVDTGVETKTIPAEVLIASGEIRAMKLFPLLNGNGQPLKDHDGNPIGGETLPIFIPYRVTAIPKLGSFEVRVDWFNATLGAGRVLGAGENPTRWQTLTSPAFEYRNIRYKVKSP